MKKNNNLKIYDIFVPIITNDDYQEIDIRTVFKPWLQTRLVTFSSYFGPSNYQYLQTERQSRKHWRPDIDKSHFVSITNAGAN